MLIFYQIKNVWIVQPLFFLEELEPEVIVKRPKSTVLLPVWLLVEPWWFCIFRRDHEVLRTFSGSFSRSASLRSRASVVMDDPQNKLRTLKRVSDSECKERCSPPPPQRRHVGLTVAGRAGPVGSEGWILVAAVPQDAQENKVTQPTEHHCAL